jgi:SPX domain protein involved in polyphosphate accumulation
LYETELLGPLPWLEHEEIFFFKLDSQLNMVNNFYKIKERELLLRSKQLEVQLETLVEIRGELAAYKIGDQDDSEKELDIESGENASAMSDMKNRTFCVSRSKVGPAQKMLCTTFVEYYKGLTPLQDYSSLNTLAFAKILKKYDKVTGKDVMNMYLRAVETSYFSSSEKVVILVEKVEALFTKHFRKNNRSEAEREMVRRRRRQIRFLGGKGHVGHMQAPRC